MSFGKIQHLRIYENIAIKRRGMSPPKIFLKPPGWRWWNRSVASQHRSNGHRNSPASRKCIGKSCWSVDLVAGIGTGNNGRFTQQKWWYNGHRMEYEWKNEGFLEKSWDEMVEISLPCLITGGKMPWMVLLMSSQQPRTIISGGGFAASPTQEMLVPAHGLPPHGSWSRGYQGFAPGQWDPYQMGDLQNFATIEAWNLRSLPFTFIAPDFPLVTISCLIFQSHIPRIANVWSQPIQPGGMDNFQTCLSVSMLVAMATETFSSGKNPTMLW